jgi:topoisomerase IV subunit A
MNSKHSPVTQVENEGTQTLKGMYKEYFLDYASYVILERAIPGVNDGLKPVQRRILHSLKEKDDGRYHKVANIIGHTMQYHPHGDAAIGDALVNLGQKDLLIDTQGNWGDVRTGDRAAAPRYIEARLTKFALEVGFNAQTTDWQLSYDGRNKEPIALPMKFPLALVQGVEGIAVGLSTKIMPHNFIELIKAAIKILEEKRFKLYPDFQTGGYVDVSDYNAGRRGGKIRVRGKIEQIDKKTIAIRELPYGQTTSTLIDSIIKANDKGKIKIRKMVDNTAKELEIAIELAPGTSPEKTIDALYAFTNCEVSISPNACVIVDNKPVFMSVTEILQISVDWTRELLRQELEIRRSELEEKWHFSSLEKIFIEKRIYHDIEESESWEEVLDAISSGLDKYIATPSTKTPRDTRLVLRRDITTDDITRLTEIKIKRISKYNVFKADEQIVAIEDELAQVNYDLENITAYTIAYYERLLSKYGKGRERRTEITEFDTIRATQVVANNAKLYANLKEGFVGQALKKDEFITECSDIDDIIAFRKDGKFVVSRIADKVFMGKNLLHVAVWKKGDDRTTYHMLYVDGATGRTMGKRFNVTAITRDKEYDLTTGAKGSKALYFTAHSNGESEVVEIQLSPGNKAKKKIFEYDFGDVAIKGRSSRGNIVTRYPVRKVVQKGIGKSTLGAVNFWMDDVSGRLNKDSRGRFLGSFDTGDQVFVIHSDGTYELLDASENSKIDTKQLIWAGKFNSLAPVSVVYFDGEKGWTMIKRFMVENTAAGHRHKFITDHRSSKVNFATINEFPTVRYSFMSGGKKQERTLDLFDFIEIKGWKALGNKLMDKKVLTMHSVEEPDDEEDAGIKPASTDKKSQTTPNLFDQIDDRDDKLETGDTIEFDL